MQGKQFRLSKEIKFTLFYRTRKDLLRKRNPGRKEQIREHNQVNNPVNLQANLKVNLDLTHLIQRIHIDQKKENKET
jgi:hypothetical protein